MTSAIYTRITSTDTRLGVERQLDDDLQLAQQLGLSDVRVYEDNDTSASSAKARPAYRRLLADIASGDVSHVIVWHADRLYRRFDDLKEIVDVVEAAGIKISSVKSGEIDLTTPAGRMIARMLGAAAAYEIEHARERIMRERQQRATDGKPTVGGRRAIGWDRVVINGETQLVLNDREAAVLREAVELLLSGASLGSTARVVSDKLGKRVRVSTLRQMLAKPSLAGLAVYRTKVVGPGEWPAIITEDQHVALTALFAQSPTQGKRPIGRKYLGSSLYVCSICRQTVRTAGHRAGVARYACEAGCCSRIVSYVDEHVRRIVAGYLDQPSVITSFSKRGDVDLGPLLEERREINARLASLSESVASGLFTLEAVTAGAVKQNARLAEIEIEIARASSSADESSSVFTSENPARAFLDGTLEEQRAVIDRLVVVTLLPALTGRPEGWKAGERYFDKRCVEIAPSEQLAAVSTS